LAATIKSTQRPPCFEQSFLNQIVGQLVISAECESATIKWLGDAIGERLKCKAVSVARATNQLRFGILVMEDHARDSLVRTKRVTKKISPGKVEVRNPLKSTRSAISSCSNLDELIRIAGNTRAPT